MQALLACSIIEAIFLIDNSPTDALKILATDKKIEYIFNNANVGYGAGHNIALRKVANSSKYHIVLNPDIYFAAGTIEKLYAFMEEHTEAGHVIPKVTYPGGNLQYTCRLLPTPADLILRRFMPAAFSRKRMELYELRNSGYNKVMEAPYLLGCFMFLRMDAVKQAGFFDERFFMYPEDIDLTRRIHRHYKTLFFPGAEIIHAYERGSYKSLKLFWIHMVNMVRYFNKWGWFIDRERTAVNKKILQQFKQ
jgi:GT2 family glycosyltransferase